MQYQGKEIHYTVTVEGEEWVVHQDIFAEFSIGDEVYVHLKEFPYSKKMDERNELHYA